MQIGRHEGGGVLGVGRTGGVASPRHSPSSPEHGAEPARGRVCGWLGGGRFSNFDEDGDGYRDYHEG